MNGRRYEGHVYYNTVFGGDGVTANLVNSWSWRRVPVEKVIPCFSVIPYGTVPLQ